MKSFSRRISCLLLFSTQTQGLHNTSTEENFQDKEKEKNQVGQKRNSIFFRDHVFHISVHSHKDYAIKRKSLRDFFRIGKIIHNKSGIIEKKS
jgi:hypothetical protein